jgi:hypothetical protein
MTKPPGLSLAVRTRLRHPGTTEDEKNIGVSGEKLKPDVCLQTA